MAIKVLIVDNFKMEFFEKIVKKYQLIVDGAETINKKVLLAVSVPRRG